MFQKGIGVMENIGSLFQALPGAVSQGVLWGIMVLGVYITFKILDIADLTVDGSFALGAVSVPCLSWKRDGDRSQHF